MTAFDFSSYVRVPRGWRIMRNDSELWLDHLASDKVYIITCPLRGEFELYYTSRVQMEPGFIRRSDSLYDILRSAGVLFPQPNMTKATQARLTAHKK